MNQEAIRELLKRRPFAPFQIKLSNGETYDARHPECAILTKSGVVIGYPDSDCLMICSYLHIAGVETNTVAQKAS